MVSKLYSSVLNKRLLNYLESEDMLVDEQNGFRPDRSCEDHVYTACTVIRNRMLNKQSTFATFIDLQKAFDFVDRDALLYRLISNGIDGKFYNSIKAMFLDTTSCVKLNGMLKPRSHEGLGPCCDLCKTSHVVKSQVDLIRARDRS